MANDQNKDDTDQSKYPGHDRDHHSVPSQLFHLQLDLPFFFTRIQKSCHLECMIFIVPMVQTIGQGQSGFIVDYRLLFFSRTQVSIRQNQTGLLTPYTDTIFIQGCICQGKCFLDQLAILPHIFVIIDLQPDHLRITVYQRIFPHLREPFPTFSCLSQQHIEVCQPTVHHPLSGKKGLLRYLQWIGSAFQGTQPFDTRLHLTNCLKCSLQLSIFTQPFRQILVIEVKFHLV